MSLWENVKMVLVNRPTDKFMDSLEGRENNSDEDQNVEMIEELQKSPEIPENSDDGSEGDEYRSKVKTKNQCSLNNICGLTDIKEALFNIFIYPAIFPQFFPGNIRWNQILLYGPPGTGKTMLTKAMATEINASLLRITSADLMSHWQGQTEKHIRGLFQEIRSFNQPTIVFFDEIDGLCRRRTNVEEDSARRIKTELLAQLDDFASESDQQRTFIVGATNCPWEIDTGFMRRFHKKIFISLPDKEARMEIIKRSFGEVETDLTEEEWAEVGDRTGGYSGSDLVNVVMTACCERFTQTKKSKYWEEKDGFWFPALPRSLFSTKINFEDIHPNQVGTRNITFSDIMTAIDYTPKTLSPKDLLKYLEFSEENQIK